MNSYAASPHNPPLVHAGVNVTVGKAAEKEMSAMEEASKKKKK